ncbi:hypothetical protein [Microcoleus sp. herbarium12]|uniref:hypothetical protein n=1 Tax=Microcoleus sp. herbarium12 TaxID=3055437 RepID=UPI002FD77C7F
MAEKFSFICGIASKAFLAIYQPSIPEFFCQCFAVERVIKVSCCCFVALATHFRLVLAGLLLKSFDLHCCILKSSSLNSNFSPEKFNLWRSIDGGCAVES